MHNNSRECRHRSEPPKSKPPKAPGWLKRTFGRAAFAVLAGTITLCTPSFSEARTYMKDAQGPKPPHAADTEKPGSSAPQRQEGTAPRAPADGVQTLVTRIREDDGEDLISIEYSDQSGRPPVSISVPFSGERGELVQSIPGRERTVLLFEKSIVIAVGHDARFRGELRLRMDGDFRNGPAVEFPLPEDCRDGNFRSATVTTGEDGSESILYFMNREGHVRAARIDAWNVPYATEQLPPSETAQLVSLGRGIAVYFEPGSGTLTFLKADFQSSSISTNPQPALPSQAPPLVSSTGAETILSIGGSRFLAAETVPGDFSSLRLVRLP